MSVSQVFVADRGDAGLRLDLVLRRHLTGDAAATRSRIQGWIESGCVTVNSAVVSRVSRRAAVGDVVVAMLPASAPRPVMQAEDVALEILYEDDSLLALNKPAGVVVHPAYRNTEGTVLNALLWRARDWPAPQRPSLVGRLDKLTSGVVIVAKTAAVHAALQRTRDMEKDYLAVVYGRVTPSSGEIDSKLSRDLIDRRRVRASSTIGAESLTRFERLAHVVAPRAGLALLRCRLVTGRTHQIRVHLASRGWPIVGDPVYGEPRWSFVKDPALASALRAFPRQALHASRVTLTHPVSGERLTCEAPLPRDIGDLLVLSGLTGPRRLGRRRPERTE